MVAGDTAPAPLHSGGEDGRYWPSDGLEIDLHNRRQQQQQPGTGV
jgi:hypothetical protein